MLKRGKIELKFNFECLFLIYKNCNLNSKKVICSSHDYKNILKQTNQTFKVHCLAWEGRIVKRHFLVLWCSCS